eukprot:jgi/Bigna1/88358/estExt_fgenesh1_pg.C_310047
MRGRAGGSQGPPCGDGSSKCVSVEFIGSDRATGMALIHPASEHPRAIEMLRELDTVLRKRLVKKLFDRMIQDEDESLRLIQGARYEIFIQARWKPSTAFDIVTGKYMSKGFSKAAILRYARHQAMRDPRLNARGQKYAFGNYSMIMNYEPVPAQAPHIDLLSPSYQFGLVVTDKIPGTLFHEGNTHIQTVGSLINTWRRQPFGGPPPKLAEVLAKEQRARVLLRDFGDVLASSSTYNCMRNHSSVSTGSLISLPGSVVHAGPGTSAFRAVIFFSASPKACGVEEYHPDTQYSSVLLSGHLVSLMWRQEGVGPVERRYLLTMLASQIEDCPIRGLWSHFSQGDFSEFIRRIEVGRFPRGVRTRAAYIASCAEQPALCSSSCQPFQDEKVVEMSNLTRVSAEGLYTMWDGRAHEVVVYRRGGGDSAKVLLYYPPREEDLKTGDDNAAHMWEGLNEGDCYRLEMHREGEEGEEEEGELMMMDFKFDGSNGVLRDSDGKEIRCSTRKHPPLLTSSSAFVRRRKRKRGADSVASGVTHGDSSARFLVTTSAAQPVGKQRRRRSRKQFQ